MSKANDTHSCTCPSGDGSLRWPCPVHPALLPCPFCGSSAEVQNESPADNSGGYFVECKSCGASTNLRYACGDDPLPLLVAQWNSRAPSKTVDGAYPALPKPAYPAQFNGHGGEQSSSEGYSAEQMRAYAVQAVAAQTPADPMSWPLPCDVTVGHGTMRKGVKLSTLVLRMKALYKMATGEDADEVAARSPEVRASMLAAFQAQIGAKPVVCDSVHIAVSGKTATPALPVTEDSSAGDLATESVLIEGVAYTIPEPVALELLRLNIELQLAEAQTEPVALQMCSDLKPRTESEKAAYLAGVADGRRYAERDANTAPQAQPADAWAHPTGRLYTYAKQPNNQEAWRIGEACHAAQPGGDPIDHGLSLLQKLQDKGYGIFTIDDAMAAAQAQPGDALDAKRHSRRR